MAQQTAVEWLEEKYRSLLIEADFNGRHIFVFDWRRNELFEQAKQIEKQQIAEAYRVGVEEDVYHSPLTTGEEYYKRTYEK